MQPTRGFSSKAKAKKGQKNQTFIMTTRKWNFTVKLNHILKFVLTYISKLFFLVVTFEWLWANISMSGCPSYATIFRLYEWFYYKLSYCIRHLVCSWFRSKNRTMCNPQNFLSFGQNSLSFGQNCAWVLSFFLLVPLRHFELLRLSGKITALISLSSRPSS